MMSELIIILVALLLIVLVYYGRFGSKSSSSLFFSERFLMRTDDHIFHFMMFLYKLYELVMGNTKTFLKRIPHKIADAIHRFSNAVSAKSHFWIEKFTNKQNPRPW